MFATDYFDAISEDAVSTAVRISDKPALISFLSEQFSRNYGLDPIVCEATLTEREALGSTGFGRGIAIPHGRISGISAPVSVIVQLQHPVDYGAVDAQPVDLIWALLSPETQGASHLKALAYVSRMLRKESLVQQLRGASNASTAYALVSEQLRQNAA
jgi:PTS system nitrogen regulatory IIA component